MTFRSRKLPKVKKIDLEIIGINDLMVIDTLFVCL